MNIIQSWKFGKVYNHIHPAILKIIYNLEKCFFTQLVAVLHSSLLISLSPGPRPRPQWPRSRPLWPRPRPPWPRDDSCTFVGRPAYAKIAEDRELISQSSLPPQPPRTFWLRWVPQRFHYSPGYDLTCCHWKKEILNICLFHTERINGKSISLRTTKSSYL